MRLTADVNNNHENCSNLDHAGHASEVVRSESFDPTKYSGIVTISGDGLMFEVLNGMYKR